MFIEIANAWAHLESIGYKPYYLAVYGSQNYNLDIYTEAYQSDSDFKCIIIPTIDDLIRNSKPISTVVEYEGGQIEVKDIRSYVESVVKCNVNFLEILDTQYYMGPDFFRGELENLMTEMGVFYIKACYGMMLEKQKALRYPYPSTKEKIKKYGYDPKQLHHIARLQILVERYVKGEYPDFYHIGGERDYLLELKTGLVPNSEVDAIVDSNINQVLKIRDYFHIEPIFYTKNRIIEMSYSIIKEQLG